jgi:hypothetical protein
MDEMSNKEAGSNMSGQGSSKHTMWNQCYCGHYHGHFILRWILRIIILFVVFGLGVMVGRFHSYDHEYRGMTGSWAAPTSWTAGSGVAILRGVGIIPGPLISSDPDVLSGRISALAAMPVGSRRSSDIFGPRKSYVWRSCLLREAWG